MRTRTGLNAGTYRWAVVGMLWFICFFNYADRVAIASVFPLLTREFHFSKADLGWISSAFTWVYAAASPFAGQFGDRYSRKLVIIGGMYVWSVITGFTALCTKFTQFVVVRGTEGLGEAFYMPASMGLVSDYHSPATRSRAIGLHGTSVYAGTVFGGTLAGWMGAVYGWRSPFIFLGAAGIVLGVALYAFIREPARNQAERIERGGEEHDPPPVPFVAFLREFARTPTAVLLIVAYFGVNLVDFVFLSWMPTFLTEKFGVKVALAGLGATVFTRIAMMAGSASGGVIADLRARVVAAGRIQVQAAAVFIATPFVFLCGYTRDMRMLIVAMTLYGFFKGVYDSNLTASFYDVITPARRSTATGLMNFLGWFGAGIGTPAIGYAVDRGATMSAAIASTAVIFLGVAGVLFFAAARTAARDIALRMKRDSVLLPINVNDRTDRTERG